MMTLVSSLVRGREALASERVFSWMVGYCIVDEILL